MHTLKEMIRRKKELRMTYEEISERSGVPVPTLQKVFSGTTESPRYNTLEKIEQVLYGEADKGAVQEPTVIYGTDSRRIPAERDIADYPHDGRRVPFKPQGSYTVEDYEMFPEDERYELIDGVLIKMDAPSVEHQQLSVFLGSELRAMAEEDPGCDCLVLLAPCDVQLDRDQKTIVQPDVMVICNEDNVNEQRGIGAPDLCIEILSASSRSRDQLLKKYKYQQAGVREYWIVDPIFQQVIVYRFGDGSGNAAEQRYGFEDRVPIGICNGEHSIDFSKRIPAFIRRRMKAKTE